MTPLIANSTTATSESTTPSSNFRMPHVFVVPPEEEQQDNPPWCCFDADEQPEDNGAFSSNPDIHSLDVSCLLQSSRHDTLAFLPRRVSVHQPRPRAPVSKKLEKKQRPEAIQIIENKPSQARQRDAREDSDVIEVVKVKRTREALTDLEENTKVKRSKTLKVRATKALQSIKNIGKASHRAHVKDIWTSSEDMPGIFKGVQEQILPQQSQSDGYPSTTPPKKGSLSRATTRSLSQIFQPAKSSRVESLFTVRVAPSVTPAEMPHTLPIGNPSSLSHLSYNNSNSSLNVVPSTFTTSDTPNRPAPPTPAMKKNINTKFSVRELHRLFSFSSSSPDDLSSSPTATGAPVSFAHSNSNPSTSASPLPPHNYPDVPMEEDLFVDVHFVDLESPERKLASQYRQTFHTHHDNNVSASYRLSDLSLEMKLDSLHFDALSFDPEDFDMSREGDMLR